MSTRRGRSPRPLLVGLAAAVVGAAVVARWLDAVEVDGTSMAPGLLPGDRLLVEAFSFTRRGPRVGEIVLASDPRAEGRELVKRVVAVEPNGDLVVQGDAGDRSTDSRAFGPLPREAIRWRVVLRYAPWSRFGPP